MVFEYMEYGDLADLLRKNDPSLHKDKPMDLKQVPFILDTDTTKWSYLDKYCDNFLRKNLQTTRDSVLK